MFARTGLIQGKSCERLYQKLGLESLESRCWFRKFIFFDKIVNRATLRYLTSYLNSNDNPVYHTRASDQEGLGQELNNSNNRFSLSVSMNGTN